MFLFSEFLPFIWIIEIIQTFQINIVLEMK